MKNTFFYLLIAHSILFMMLSCSNEKEQNENVASTMPSDTIVSDSTALSSVDLNQKPATTGLERFEIDTITQSEFDNALLSYKNAYTHDTSFLKKQGHVLTIPLSGKNLVLEDEEDPEDETAVIYYNIEGRLKEDFLYVTISYYEGFTGLMIQPAINKIDTIYSSPLISPDENALISPIDEYGAIGTTGFLYCSKEKGFFTPKVEVNTDEIIFQKVAWDQTGSLICQIYPVEYDSMKESHYMYLKLTLK